MNPAEKPRLDVDPAEAVYRYVERRGAVEPSAVHEGVDLHPRTIHVVIETLEREGYLRREDGRLRVALETGAAETFRAGGLAYTVRPARQEDVEGIIKAIRRIVEEDRYVVAETVAEALLYEDAVIRHNYAESRVFFVATADDGVVGWTHLDSSPVGSLAHTAQQTVGVLPPYRGYGVGRRLLDRGLAWAADAGVEKVYNSLPATSEDAIAFLRGQGCTVDAVRPDHFRIDGETVDEVMLAVDPADAGGAKAGRSAAAEEAPTAAAPGRGVDRATADLVWENLLEEVSAVLAASDEEARRFHARQGLQYAALGLDEDG